MGGGVLAPQPTGDRTPPPIPLPQGEGAESNTLSPCQQRAHDFFSAFSNGRSSLSTSSAVSGPTKRLRMRPVLSST